MYLGYVKMSGIEMVNHERVNAGLSAGLGNGIGIPMPDLWGCDTIVPDDPGPYTLPHVAPLAPWYDAARPESAHFAGVILESVQGLDDPYSDRSVSQAVIGGAMGGLRLGPRTLVCEATLLGLSTMALDYGLEWLTGVLAGRVCGADTICYLGDLEFFATCPSAARGALCGPGVPVVDETALGLRRTGFSGGLISGPRVVDREWRQPGHVVAYRVVFALAMETPWFAAPAVTAASGALTAPGAVGTEAYECPGFVDPCPPLSAADLAAAQTYACASLVEDTCDWNSAWQDGPSSWSTQAWTPTGEEVVSAEGGCSMVLTRTGDAGIDGCTRPSLRLSFAGAAGGSGPVELRFELTAGQGNIHIQLWNPGTDQGIPISGVTKPSGSGAYTWASPTGDAYNLLDTTSVGAHVLRFTLPAGVDPGTLKVIIWAFGGGEVGAPVSETLSNIRLYYQGTAGGGGCCSFEVGDPIYDPTYSVPCYTVPGSSHRTIAELANPSLIHDMGIRVQLGNAGATETANLRVGIYDPTLLGLAAGTSPSGWPGGVQEWECTALVGEFFVPSIPAGMTVDVDARRRQVLTYPVGVPTSAVSGDRYFYGGPDAAWMFEPVPPCSTWWAVVFADSASTPAEATVQIDTAALHLMFGAAR